MIIACVHVLYYLVPFTKGACAIRKGKVDCWGATNNNGLLGREDAKAFHGDFKDLNEIQEVLVFTNTTIYNNYTKCPLALTQHNCVTKTLIPLSLFIQNFIFILFKL